MNWSERAHELLNRPEQCARTLMMVICGLAVMNALTLVSEFGFGYDHAKGFVPLFRLNAERNIPTLYAVLQLITASWLAYRCGKESAGSRWSRHWVAVSLVLLFMAADEGFTIHELFDTYQGWTNGWVETTGIFDGPWVIAYSVVVAVVGLVFLPFFLHLSRNYQIIFGGAALLYVAGAIGFEMVGAVERTVAGETLRYEIINSIEELMELTAVAISIVGLIIYRQNLSGSIRG